MRSCASTSRTHVDCVGIDVMIVTLQRVLVHIAVLMDEAARTDLYAYTYARLVPHLTHGLYHVCG